MAMMMTHAAGNGVGEWLERGRQVPAPTLEPQLWHLREQLGGEQGKASDDKMAALLVVFHHSCDLIQWHPLFLGGNGPRSHDFSGRFWVPRTASGL